LALLPLTALAGPLDDAKADGLVGERVDGYVGIVPASVPADVQDLVERVNDQRRAKYTEVAKQRDVPVEAVAAIAGKKLVQRAGSGEYVAGPDGRWQQK
ncbi:MAG: YdbL family protein, partial [Geminicoccaceae bacterium]|nr:YdbL family protein [Geminicoccaceae bacterium]